METCAGVRASGRSSLPGPSRMALANATNATVHCRSLRDRRLYHEGHRRDVSPRSPRIGKITGLTEQPRAKAKGKPAVLTSFVHSGLAFAKQRRVSIEMLGVSCWVGSHRGHVAKELAWLLRLRRLPAR